MSIEGVKDTKKEPVFKQVLFMCLVHKKTEARVFVFLFLFILNYNIAYLNLVFRTNLTTLKCSYKINNLHSNLNNDNNSWINLLNYTAKISY